MLILFAGLEAIPDDNYAASYVQLRKHELMKVFKIKKANWSPALLRTRYRVAYDLDLRLEAWIAQINIRINFFMRRPNRIRDTELERWLVSIDENLIDTEKFVHAGRWLRFDMTS